jgi:hypothetical protein
MIKQMLTAGAVVWVMGAQAAPFANLVDMGTGPLSFDVGTETQDTAYEVHLGPGTYDFSVDLQGVNKTSFIDVWLSSSAQDKNAGGGNDFYTYASDSSLAGGTFSMSLAAATDLYFDVNASHPGNDGFVGTLSVTPVPEPQPGVLILAGLGALGIASSRSRRRT